MVYIFFLATVQFQCHKVDMVFFFVVWTSNSITGDHKKKKQIGKDARMGLISS